MSKQKVKIDGFRMHQAILNEFRFIRDQSFERPPASAYVVYFTMLKQLHIEDNARGILKEYNLAYWAKKLDIPYSTLYGGKKYLEKYHFVNEEIIDGKPVLVLRDVEKYNTPERKDVSLNYLIIPHALFETNILAEFVRTSNPEGIELLLSLLNQFRTSMSKKNEIHVKHLSQERTMKTLKESLNKNAKGVRRVLSILESIFNIEYIGLTYRGKQIWIQKVKFTLKEECVKENSDEFQVQPLMAKFSQELTYFLDGHKLKYKPRDKKDIMIAFKQEVINKIKYLLDEDQSYEYRDKWLKSFFLQSLDSVGEYIQNEINRNGSFKIRTSIGALFRGVFRRRLPDSLKNIPYELLHDAKVREYIITGEVPALQGI
jgi:hypothetical protein